ncbi:hypothetical protein Tco_0746746 [Tanacetum coccineum]
MDLQFPDGQLAYVAVEGLSTSAFLPELIDWACIQTTSEMRRYNSSVSMRSPVQEVIDSCRAGKIVDDDRVSRMRKKVWNQSILYLALVNKIVNSG